MGTRSAICVKKANFYHTIYCHWDGYPESQGPLLTRHYKHAQKVRKLIRLGSLSCLNKSIVCRKEHSFDKPDKNTVIAYARDRGEPLTILKTDELVDRNNIDAEFFYLFENSKWRCFTYNGQEVNLYSGKYEYIQ